MLQTVYRLERAGKGPYRVYHGMPDKMGKLRREMTKSHTYCPIHPTWQADQLEPYRFKGVPEEDWLAGCLTKQELEQWFGKFLPGLIENGFRIVEYVARHWVVGSRQVIFLKYHDPKRNQFGDRVVHCETPEDQYVAF